MADAARGMGSLAVANVQALAETCNNRVDEPVPGRYLSKDPSAEEVVAADDSTYAIPVIDFRRLLDPESSSEECARLGSACRDWGFFQVLEGAFVVNVGDALEIVSNGAFRSVEHRAVIHPTKERISVALFHFPDQDRMLGPLQEMVKKGDRVRYGTTTYQDFMKQFLTAKLDGRKHIERLKLLE